MKPTKFPQANRNLGAPRGMPDVRDLPVWSDGNECVSCWKMTWRERFSALIFGRVWLRVRFGATQPPVALHVKRAIFLPEDTAMGVGVKA